MHGDSWSRVPTALKKKWSFATKREAYENAAKCCGDPRIVRLVPKKKPRVVSKLVVVDTWCGVGSGGYLVPMWIRSRRGKPIRITLEELADDE